ncbi:DUF3093 family protein [Microbacterium sp. BWT-B31]|uniref:DUF3093 family protein n=1 Tax=Microbacterium sp. BWT-B31 TaxID=3232072 RepID=UPI0035284189
MQIPSAHVGARPAVTTYRERLSPSLWAIVAAAVCAPMAALVLTPIDTTLALLVGVAVGVGVVAAMVFASPVVEVRDGELRAGRAHIDLEWLANPRALTADAARTARGAELHPRSWHLIRGGIDGIVVVDVTDPDDPAPSWVLSSRTPDRLASAVRRAAATQRTPRR